MLTIRKILFPTDFSDEAGAAFAPALRMAEIHGAEIHTLHVATLHADDPHHPEHRFPDPDLIARELTRDAAEELEGAASGLDPTDVRIVRAQRRALTPAPAIVDYAVEHGIDLIVMGSHGRSGLGRLLLGSVTEAVLRTAECPVLAFRSRREGAPRRGEPRRIVVPTDFSDPAERALEHALHLAGTTRGRIHLLHVLELDEFADRHDPARGLEFDLSRLRERARAAHERCLERAGTSAAAGVQVDLHVQVGHAVREITLLAKAIDADMVVMATHGRTGLDRVTMGSVAEGVLRDADCPVLLLKPWGRTLLPRSRGTRNDLALDPEAAGEGGRGVREPARPSGCAVPD